jgi:hypothetical protein
VNKEDINQLNAKTRREMETRTIRKRTKLAFSVLDWWLDAQYCIGNVYFKPPEHVKIATQQIRYPHCISPIVERQWEEFKGVTDG